MTSWTPGATAAVILTACLGVGWAAAVVAVAVHGGAISTEGMRYVAGLGQTLAGALVAFVGITIGRRNGNGKGNHS
jgi:hypothetical protein